MDNSRRNPEIYVQLVAPFFLLYLQSRLCISIARVVIVHSRFANAFARHRSAPRSLQ